MVSKVFGLYREQLEWGKIGWYSYSTRFPNVFPKDLLRLLPEGEIEFTIELVQRTTLILRDNSLYNEEK